jgi:hypothetical protein
MKSGLPTGGAQIHGLHRLAIEHCHGHTVPCRSPFSPSRAPFSESLNPPCFFIYESILHRTSLLPHSIKKKTTNQSGARPVPTRSFVLICDNTVKSGASTEVINDLRTLSYNRAVWTSIHIAPIQAKLPLLQSPARADLVRVRKSAIEKIYNASRIVHTSLPVFLIFSSTSSYGMRAVTCTSCFSRLTSNASTPFVRVISNRAKYIKWGTTFELG